MFPIKLEPDLFILFFHHFFFAVAQLGKVHKRPHISGDSMVGQKLHESQIVREASECELLLSFSIDITIKMPPFKECSLEMSGPSSGALKDGVSLKAILAEISEGGGCLSDFAIWARWRMIIAVGGAAPARIELYLFHICWISNGWEAGCAAITSSFLNLWKILTFSPCLTINLFYKYIYLTM